MMIRSTKTRLLAAAAVASTVASAGCTTARPTAADAVMPLRLHERGVAVILAMPACEQLQLAAAGICSLPRWADQRRDRDLGVPDPREQRSAQFAVVEVDLRRRIIGDTVTDSIRSEVRTRSEHVRR
ncbi:MAG: hypothetical protein KAS72_09025 [Phycisphaerales bacterium]|nr:hypothetical protein [Phycisphaerales bacterium]